MNLKTNLFNILLTTLLLPPSFAVMAAKKTTPTIPARGTHHLVTADWTAVCTSGSPATDTGCLGNTSSPAFHVISNGTGGFTSWANIQPQNAPESIFIKAFLAGTNTPIAPPNISINVPQGAARCALFTTQGEAIGDNGISNLNPTPGSVLEQPAPVGLIIALNMSTGGFSYEQPPAPFEADPEDPIYVMCVAYDPTDGSSAAPTAGSITAI